MNAFNRILVAMDLSDADYRLLEYTRFIGEQFAPEKVYFVHVSPNLEIPDYAKDWYDGLGPVPLDERLRDQMEREVKLKIKPGLFPAEYNVLEGNVTNQLLHWADVKSTDLVILGHKERHLGSGLAARRFLHKTDNSVLFVPQKARTRISRILLPTDFSGYSTQALKLAIDMAAEMNPVPVIDLLHVYEIPNGVHYQISRTREQFAGIIKANTEEYLEKYLKDIRTKNIPLETHLIENTHFNTARHIMEYADKSQADMIMMGAKGHNALERLLLGSNTEKTLNYNYHLPLLIIRPLSERKTAGQTGGKGSREDLISSI